MKIQDWVTCCAIGLGASLAAGSAMADGNSACSGLPSWAVLKSKLQTVVQGGNDGGLGFNMWATLVANDGTVCAVAFSGGQYTDQWLASRAISAQKANTANGLSLSNGAPPPSSFAPNGFALSTANLYSAVQPGGSLYGLQHSNPVDPEVAYKGPAILFGTPHDPLVGERVGGVNVFGGGLALYANNGKKIGAIGVSGDTSCTDHFVSWRVRAALDLDHLGSLHAVPGNDPQHPDNIIFDITTTDQGGLLNPVGKLSKSASGFGHPTCIGSLDPAGLPPVRNP